MVRTMDVFFFGTLLQTAVRAHFENNATITQPEIFRLTLS